MPLKFFSFGGHFVQWRGPVCLNVVEGIMRNISVKYSVEFGPMVKEKMSLFLSF